MIPIFEALEYFKGNYSKFTTRMTNYSCKITTQNEKFFFSTFPMSKKVFIYYNSLKAQIKGEVREKEIDFKYFDFEGIESSVENLFCVDINSAYLSVLLNENVIDQKTFDHVKTAKKTHRLQSVGMFASCPYVTVFENGEFQAGKEEENPYSWVFYLACKKTFEAMDAVKKAMREDFVFYWVDGIFIKKNPEKAVSILKEMGFESKIEIITNFRKTDKSALYYKDGKKIVLSIPKTKKMDRKTLKSITSKTIKKV